MNVAVLAAPDGTTSATRRCTRSVSPASTSTTGPGEKTLTVDIDGVRTSIFICYDLRFADDFWALAHDTDCYVVVANWPAARREHWQALLRARAIENQAYVVGANRVGEAMDDDGRPLEHAGDSAIIDPLGRTLAEAAHVQTVLTADVDPAEVARVRARFPFLDDRTKRPASDAGALVGRSPPGTEARRLDAGHALRAGPC